ncbi:MAG: type I DNA topoisomerase [Alphaproteobacteria bacterium]|nr:type I DNA topoisomerase [Alphaproteobacteria bacterium]
MTKNVVVVESPAKAKTINKYLGNDYVVIASYGHVRDLPAKNGSVLPDNQFSMIWETDNRGEKQINEIVAALKGADNLYLATDPDREGEAISWHVQQALEDRKALKNTSVQRIVFHEITKSAVSQAMQHPRAVNSSLVEAYLARRALDYLVGFTLSPVLWRKLPGSRSAGRVQSVALRLIVEREQEIEAFITQEYWTISASLLTAKRENFTARLTHYQGKKLDKFDIPNSEKAHKICKELASHDLAVDSIEKKQTKRHPAPPFITSTLQQEAARKLGFSASRTMQVAQKLYEGVAIGGETTGLITYMRTDSVQLAQEAIVETRSFLKKAYGENYVPSAPRQFKNKSKNAQEAHEAIRPTQLSRRPQEVAAYLDENQLKLYELIWKRTLASQMESALFDQVSIDITDKTKETTFRANGSTQVFDGFLRLYQEGIDEGSETEDGESILPIMNQGEALGTKSIDPFQHFTQPPPRFTEASLVKKLEELGIGRPSTYASLIQVLQDRDYVKLEKRQFIPEDRGRLVTSFLTHFFKRYVEYDFTANLEEQLDEISSGQRPWRQVMESFWKDFHETVEATQPLRITEVIEKLEEDLDRYLFQGVQKEQRVCPLCSQGHVSLKLGRFGAFLGCSNYPECKYTRPIGQGNDASSESRPDSEPVEIGNDPDTNEAITLRKGPYGAYLQWDPLPGQQPAALPPSEEESEKTEKKVGKKPAKKKAAAKPKPKRISIPNGFSASDMTLEMALKLKELPKDIGINPDTNLSMVIGIGRFGPYVKHGTTFVSIPKAINVLEITPGEAQELIEKKSKQPAKAPRKAKAAPKAKKVNAKKEKSVAQ